MIETGVLIEWMAFGVGTVGTVLWALGVKWNDKPLEGWFWLASALLWIVFATLNGHQGLAARDLIGAALYVAGIWRAFATKPAAAVALPASPNPSCALCRGTGVHRLAGPGTSDCVCAGGDR